MEICISQISFGRVLPARDCFEHGKSGMVYGGDLILKITRALHKYKMDANYAFHTKSVQLKTEPKPTASLTAAV